MLGLLFFARMEAEFFRDVARKLPIEDNTIFACPGSVPLLFLHLFTKQLLG